MLTSTVSEVTMGEGMAVWQSIHEPSKDMVIWERPLAQRLMQWLNQLAPEQLPRARLTIKPGDTVEKIRVACDACGTPAVADCDQLITDISDLVKHFSQLAECETVRLRLDVLNHNACSKWHRDSVPLRLICTYRGPGTQWIAATDSVEVLARPDDEAASARTIQTGHVALFKGQGFADQTHGSGVVHRSPRIAAQKLARLVLVLDLPFDWRG